MDFEKFIKNLPFRFFFFFFFLPPSSFVNLPNVQMQEKDPPSRWSQSLRRRSWGTRAPRGAPAGNSPFNYRLAESKLYCNEICDAGQGAAGLLISQIRVPWEPSRLVRVVKFFWH